MPRAAAVITVSDGIAQRLAQLYGLRVRPVVVRNVSALGDGAAPPGRACAPVWASPRGPRWSCTRSGGTDARLRDPGAGDGGGGRCAPGLPRRRRRVRGFNGELARLAERLGIADRVHFVASQPLEGLLALTREADAGVTLLEDTCVNHQLASAQQAVRVHRGRRARGGQRPARDGRPRARARRIGWTADPPIRSPWRPRSGSPWRRTTFPRCTATWTPPPRSCAGDAERECLEALYGALAAR
ncbi:MAG: hypothetical protein R2736_02630 [Solirubrobacterales bacterium]